MIKVIFRIHRDAKTTHDKFQKAVLQSGPELGAVPSLRRYFHHFVQPPYGHDAEGYLELWLEEGTEMENIMAAPGIEALLVPQAPFWLELMDD
ncbi:MAG: hypothetical protein ACI8S6_004001 [Myxococcota bacterium]|jgi:hypothetical protein